MAYQIPEGSDFVVWLYPDVEPASATLTFYSPGGSSLATPVVAVDTVSATVQTVTDQTSCAADTASGMVVDRLYWWRSTTGASGKVRLSEIDGTDLTLESPPPGTLGADDTLTGLRCSATLPASALGTRNTHYRLEWVITDTSGDTHRYRQIGHVVRTPFRAPVTPDEVSRYAANVYPHFSTARDSGYYRALAQRASDRVIRRIVASGRYPHLIGDAALFSEAGHIAMRMELAQDGMIPPGYDGSLYLRDQEEALARAIAEAVAGTYYDSDDSGSVDETTERRSLYSISLVRQ